MTLTVMRYGVGDAALLDLQTAQLTDMTATEHARLSAFAPEGAAWSFWRGDVLVGCGGIQLVRDGVGEAWAMIAAPRRAEWGALLEMGRGALAMFPARRIQATATINHPGADRVLERLGFQFEGVMRGYAADGGDAKLYARVS